MLSVHRDSIQFILANPKFAMGLTGLVFVSGVVFELLDTNAGTSTIMWFVIYYAIHRSLMFGENKLSVKSDQSVRPHATGRFILVSIGFFAAALIPALVIAYKLIGHSDRNTFIGLVLLLYAASLLVILPILGTMFPAAAAADKFGLKLTLRRAKTTWYRILGGIIVGPVPYWAAYYFCLFWFSKNVVAIDLYYTETNGIQFDQIAIGIVLAFLQLIGAILMVSVLCRAYRDVAPESVKTVLV